MNYGSWVRVLAASILAWVFPVAAQQAPTNDTYLKEHREATRVIRETPGNSCEDVARLEKAASTTSNEAVRKEYLRAADKKRKDGIHEAVAGFEELRRFNSDWWLLGDRDDGTHSNDKTPDSAIESLRISLTLARCHVLDDPQKIGILDNLKTSLTEATRLSASHKEREVKCRKNRICKAKRLAIRNSQYLCELTNRRDFLKKTMEEERANPSGVVDLVKLHDLGETIQETEIEIADAKKSFLAKTKTHFSKEICSELPVNKETGEYVTFDYAEDSSGGAPSSRQSTN